MKFIEDKDNICLRCANAVLLGPNHPCGGRQAWCDCNLVSLKGANKGARRQCKDFKPKTTGGETNQ